MSVLVTDPSLQRPIEAVTASAIIASISGALPSVIGVLAGVLGCIYYAILIWESKTVQQKLGRRKPD